MYRRDKHFPTETLSDVVDAINSISIKVVQCYFTSSDEISIWKKVFITMAQANNTFVFTQPFYHSPKMFRKPACVLFIKFENFRLRSSNSLYLYLFAWQLIKNAFLANITWKEKAKRSSELSREMNWKRKGAARSQTSFKQIFWDRLHICFFFFSRIFCYWYRNDALNDRKLQLTQ